MAAGAGLVGDRLLGEPPVRWHPVAWFGTTMNAIESRWWTNERGRGVQYAAAGVVIGVVPAVVLRRVVGPSIATAVASAAAIAGAMLEREARAVGDSLAADDVPEARLQLSRLVGRSTDTLDAPEIVRAVIETVAENTVDAVTASLCWASVGGAPGAFAHRAINTMDAMVGHRTDRHERFGSASARLDDAANWLPGRLTAVAVAVAAPRQAAEVWRTVRCDAGQHPSPNGGVIEAAFAASLGIRLGGTNVYDGVAENRGELGSGRAPAVGDIDRAVALARRVACVFVVGALLVEQCLRKASRAWRLRRSGRG